MTAERWEVPGQLDPLAAARAERDEKLPTDWRAA